MNFNLSAFSLLLFLFFTCLSSLMNPLFAEVSSGNGDWNNINTWQSGTNCGSGIAVTSVPASTSQVRICNGHTVTIPLNVTVSQNENIQIQGGSLIINHILNINNKTLRLQDNGMITINAGSTLNFASGSNIYSQEDNNIFNNQGTVTFTSGSNITLAYGSFTFRHNSSNNITIDSLQIIDYSGADIRNLIIQNNSTGTISIGTILSEVTTTGTTNPTQNNITLGGTGSFNITNSITTNMAIGSTNNLNFNAPVTYSGSNALTTNDTAWSVGSMGSNASFTINGDQAFNISANGSFTVNSGGTFAMTNRTAVNNYTINNTGVVNINDGANLNITHNGLNDMRFFPTTSLSNRMNLGNINITLGGNSTGVFTIAITPNAALSNTFSINNLTINKTTSSGIVSLALGTSINNLFLNSGSLRLDNTSTNTINNSYTQGAGTTLTFNSNNRNMIFNGNTWNVNSGAMITTAMGITSGGLTIGGSSNLNITLPNMFNVNELTINNPNVTVNQPAAITLNELSSRGVYNQNNTLTVNNNFTIQNGGTFNAGSQVLNFQNTNITNSGSFNGGTGTVNFTTNNGTNRSVTGVWNFFNVNFINTAMAQTVSFMPGIAGAITVDGTFSVQGASGALLTLNSSTIGNQFLLNTQNKGAFNYIRVQDSNVAGSNPSILPLTTVSASRIINLGNNNGWFTAPTGQVLRIGFCCCL